MMERTTVTLNKIPYLDFPELKFNDHESTEMPFRYVKGDDGKPIMPEVSPLFLGHHGHFWHTALHIPIYNYSHSE